MPDSPDSKHNPPPSVPPLSLSMSGVAAGSRPLSTSSSISGMNGSHSPLSGINGRTPSPPTGGGGSLVGGGGMGQQLPPACGARQLSKLKRFLTTLQQFGSDISPEIGDRVRTLVLGLVNSHLSIEEFHTKLQEATNFPLRPFVIPFLKANLPLLQRELLHCARMAKQTPQQFLTQNEHVVFDPSHSPLDSHDSVTSDLNENGKRRASPENRPKLENGSMESLMMSSSAEPLHPAKRHHPSNNNNTTTNSGGSPLGSSRISPNGSLNLGSGAPIRLEDISLSRELRERERMERERAAAERERAAAERERERERHFSGSYNNYNRSDSFDPLERLDDDWRHVETMLNCILGMVDKTKRALAVLQERSLRDREELAVWMRRHAEGLLVDPSPDLLKKHLHNSAGSGGGGGGGGGSSNNNNNGGGGVGGGGGDVMAFAVRQTEDRVAEVRRRAEEAVNEVKRQAMMELQKAVAAAESKASEMVMCERVKMERVLQQARTQARDEVLGSVNHQEESSESCWNCGRKASETCSGCNVARYCGSFCQHKDWENHHLVCGKAQVAAIAQARDQRRGLPASASSSTTTTLSSSSSSSSSSAVAGTGSSSSVVGAPPVSGAPAVPKEMPSTTTITTTSSSSSDLPPPPTSTASGSDVTATSSSSAATSSSSSSALGGSSEARAVGVASPAASESEKTTGLGVESSR